MINKTWSVFMHFFSGCDSLAVNSGWFRLFRHEISPPPRVCFVHQTFVQQRWLCIILVSGLILAQKFLEFRYWNPSKIDQSWLSTKHTHTQLVGSICLPLQGTKISHLGKRKIIFPATFKRGYVRSPEGIYWKGRLIIFRQGTFFLKHKGCKNLNESRWLPLHHRRFSWFTLMLWEQTFTPCYPLQLIFHMG